MSSIFYLFISYILYTHVCRLAENSVKSGVSLNSLVQVCHEFRGADCCIVSAGK